MWRSVFLLLLVSFLLPFNLIKSFRESISSFFFFLHNFSRTFPPGAYIHQPLYVLLFSLTPELLFPETCLFLLLDLFPTFCWETTSLTFKEKILGEKKNESLHILKGFCSIFILAWHFGWTYNSSIQWFSLIILLKLWIWCLWHLQLLLWTLVIFWSLYYFSHCGIFYSLLFISLMFWNSKIYS